MELTSFVLGVAALESPTTFPSSTAEPPVPAPHGFSLFVPRTVRGASAFCCFLDAGPPVVQTGVFGDGPTTGEALTSIDDDDDADVVTCSGSAIGRGQTAFQMRRRCFRNVCVATSRACAHAPPASSPACAASSSTAAAALVV